jgi:NADH:ubiquinone reductase (H+-translocating)
MAVPHVLIIGGGFGGLTAAQALARAPVRVTLLDRTNHHLFQPLLYQVAMAGLSPADIASPIRSVLSEQKNATVLLQEVTAIDLTAKTVRTDQGTLTYDFIVLAMGARTDYFGHDEWEKFAPGLKTIHDATDVRRRVLLAFEQAECETDEAARTRLLTFVVIGAGPTGVELAGALAELSGFVLEKDFRSIDVSATRVILLEGGPRVLAPFPPALSIKAETQLKDLGVEIRVGSLVTCIDETGVEIGTGKIEAATVLWAAGVRPESLVSELGLPVDRGGRVIVESDLTLPGHPEAFAIGDMAFFKDDEGRPLPGVSPVAMQEARFVATRIAHPDRPRGKFRYRDKGTMATIGRSRAVAVSSGLKMSGFLAWMAWLVVHLWFLVGFRNRFVVMFEWAWSYFTYRRGARLIIGKKNYSAAPEGSDTRFHERRRRLVRASRWLRAR